MKTPETPMDQKKLANERKEQWGDLLQKLRDDAYYQASINKFNQVVEFALGETDEAPESLIDQITDLENLYQLLNPIHEWNFIDRRLLMFMCQDTFIYKKEKYYRGYYKKLFQWWLQPQLESEEKGEAIFPSMVAELEEFEIDSWLSFQGYLDEIRKPIFLHTDGSPNSLGQFTLEYLEKDQAKVLSILEEENSVSDFIPLLSHHKDVLNDLINELVKVKEYEGQGANIHLPYSNFREILKIDAKTYEQIVYNKLNDTTCESCKIETLKLLYEHFGEKYHQQTIEQSKATLKFISNKKNEDKGKYNFPWSDAKSTFSDDTPDFIIWLCQQFGNELKEDLFGYVRNTYVLNIKVVRHLVNYYKQDAIEVGIEALRITKSEKNLPHFRQIFSIIDGLDFSDHYMLIWEIASCELPSLGELACFALSGDRSEEVVSKAIAYLSSENKDERRAGVTVISQIGEKGLIDALLPIIEAEKIDEVRNIAVKTYYEAKKNGPASKDQMLERINLSMNRGKLKKATAKWIEEMPALYWSDGKKLSAEERNFIFYRQKSSGEILPEIEAAPMYELLDAEKSAAYAQKLFKYLQKKNAIKSPAKFTFAFIGKYGDDSLVPALKELVIKSQNLNACIILGMMGSMEAARALEEIMQHYHTKYPNVRQEAEVAFSSIAEQLGLTYFELKDELLPDFGFEHLQKTIDEGEGFTMRIGSDLKFELTNSKGKQLKSIPKATKETKDLLKVSNALLKQTSKLFVSNLEFYLVTQRQWQGKDWLHFFLNNPLANASAQSLVWQKGENDTFTLSKEQSCLDKDGKVLEIKDDDSIRIAHPIHLATEDIQHWKGYFSENKLTPIINQLDRKINYPLEAECHKKYTSLFKGKEIFAGTFKNRAHKKGWKRGGIGDGGGVRTYRKAFTQDSIEVFVETKDLNVQGMHDETISTGKCYFTRLGTVNINSFFYSDYFKEDDERTLLLKDIPEIVYSESINDLEEIMHSKSADE